MKRYANIFTIPFLLIILVTLFSGFGMGSSQDTVKALLKERTSIMQQALLKQIDIKEAEERLYQIETQPLLGEDIRSLRESANTDIDIVQNLELVHVKKIKKLYNYLSYQCELIWNMSGINGSYIETVEYVIVLKDFGNLYKLSDFYPIYE